MSWLSDFAVCLAALILVTAALICLFDSILALTLLRNVGITAAALLFGPPLLWELLRAGNPGVSALVLVLAMFAAYVVREHRRPRPGAPQRRGAVERKPVLPRPGDDT
jgi:hypothetical protein